MLCVFYFKYCVFVDLRPEVPFLPPFQNVEINVVIDPLLVIQINIDLTLIINNILETEEFVLVVTPNTNPCDDGSEGSTLQLDGEAKFLTITTEASNCLGNPNACVETGLTFRLNIKLLALVEDTYLFSSGGENSDVSGMAMFYKFGKFQVCHIFRYIVCNK